MRYPKGWRPWAKTRKRFRWKWGDATGELYDARTEYGCAVYSERLIFLHPHLRQKEHHDMRWDTEGHELLHQISPTMRHATIFRLERRAGQILHDRIHGSGCQECAESSASPKSGSRRS